LHGVGGAGTGYVTVCSGNFPPVGTLDVFVKEPEFINALGGTGMKTFEINANALLSQVSVGSMQINVEVPSDLSAAAAHGMVTLYRRGDSSLAVPVSASVSNGKLSVTLSGDDMTGNFSLVAPSYSSMQVSTSSIEINGQPAYEVVGNSGVTFAPAEISTQELNILREQGRLPVTTAVSGPTTQESPAPALYAAYDAGQVNALGVPVESLKVCGISASGELKIYKTSPAPMQPNKIVAEIDTPSPRYVVMGSTTPVIPDRDPPTTALTLASAFVLDAASTPVTALDHVDLNLVGTDDNDVQYSTNSGMSQSFWILDPPESVYQYGLSSATISLFQSGNGSQPLAEGRHMIFYGSVDNAGNYEDIKAYILNADHTPPVAEGVAVGGGGFVLEDIQYANPRSTVTFIAQDPESHEVASGVTAFQYFVDISSSSCPAGQYSDPVAPPGSCSNNYAAAPAFQLSGGTHTLSYSPLDLVRNAGAYKVSAVAIDDAAPQTQLFISSPTWEANGILRIPSDAQLTLSALDPPGTDGIATGLKRIVRLIDTEPGSCNFALPSYSTATVGTVELQQGLDTLS